MKLLIDAGNTRIKWCWYDGENLPLEYESAEYEDLENEGASLFQTDGPDANDILICNVGGEELTGSFNHIFADWQLTPKILHSTRQCGDIQNAYRNPKQLGVDRWMALLGAWAIQQDAVCIVDCGTAVTIDVLNDEGQHLGGMIVPGIELMQEALKGKTDGINNNEDMQPNDSGIGLLAADTGSAVEAGTLYALVALIDRVRQDVSIELDSNLPLIINGGDADLIQPLLSCESSYEPMLIFQGMLVAEEKLIESGWD